MAGIETRAYQPQVEVKKEQQSYLRKKNRETVGSDAFNLEYDAPPTREEMRRDIISYLGEYRLQVQKYDYQLIFGRDKDKRGPIELRDQDRGEAMSFKTKRVIEERTRKGEPVHREEAEDKAIALLNEQLRYAKTGDTLVWASPPGPKEQGYGNYGFIYAGKVTKQANGEAQLAMSAIRVENPTIEQYNKAFTALTGELIQNKVAEEFLASPKIVRKDMEEHEVNTVLQSSFAFQADQQEKQKFAAIIKQMEPLIDDFLDVMEHGSREQKLKGFYKLENYALKLKKEFGKRETVVYRGVSRLDDLSDRYTKRPPAVPGSCGLTGGVGRSNGLISGGRFSGDMPRMGGSSKEWFTCPKCDYKADGPIGNKCPGCGLTKEEYAAESGVSCD